MILIPVNVQAELLPTFGYLENVRVGPTDLLMRAKLDTGADTSSLGYQKIDFFSRNGRHWVRINVQNIEGKSIEIERRIVRTSRVKRHNADSIERPVIRVSVCLGGIHRLTEVSLANRSDFSVPVLIGRSFLSGTALADSAREY
ncbi:unnamed protein product, partial [Laminaria digitata]